MDLTPIFAANAAFVGKIGTLPNLHCPHRENIEELPVSGLTFGHYFVLSPQVGNKPCPPYY